MQERSGLVLGVREKKSRGWWCSFLVEEGQERGGRWRAPEEDGGGDCWERGGEKTREEENAGES